MLRSYQDKSHGRSCQKISLMTSTCSVTIRCCALCSFSFFLCLPLTSSFSSFFRGPGLSSSGYTTVSTLFSHGSKTHLPVYDAALLKHFRLIVVVDSKARKENLILILCQRTLSLPSALNIPNLVLYPPLASAPPQRCSSLLAAQVPRTWYYIDY
jgi:hypothetical protein